MCSRKNSFGNKYFVSTARTSTSTWVHIPAPVSNFQVQQDCHILSETPEIRLLYLSSRRASPPFGRYQIVLLGDRNTCTWTTYIHTYIHTYIQKFITRTMSNKNDWIQGRCPKSPATYWSPVQRPDHYATEPHITVAANKSAAKTDKQQKNLQVVCSKMNKCSPCSSLHDLSSKGQLYGMMIYPPVCPSVCLSRFGP